MSNRASNLRENNRFSQFGAEITRSISFARNKRGRFQNTRVRMHDRDIVRKHNYSVDAITGLRCGKLSRIPTHACTRGEGGERERVIRANFLKNEFLVVTTRNQLHHGATITARRSSRIIECITKRNRILDALNSLQTATQACVIVLEQSRLATRSNDSDPQLYL